MLLLDMKATTDVVSINISRYECKFLRKFLNKVKNSHYVLFDFL